MDYIREINAFYDHDLANRLSQSAACLYLAVLNMANRLFWKEGFVVSDAMLMARSGIKDRRTLKRALAELARNNLLVIQEDRRGSAYTVCGLSGRPARDAANDAARIAATYAAKDGGYPAPPRPDSTGYDALNAAQNPELAEKTAENAALDPANHAGGNSGDDRIDGIYHASQTKPIKQNQTEKQSADADQDRKDDESTDADGSHLIARLVQEYRSIPGIEETRSDYSFIGALLNEHGFQKLRYAINEMALAAAAGHIQKPLPYLRAILKRAGPVSGPDPPGKGNQNGEEDPLERYERERYRG